MTNFKLIIAVGGVFLYRDGELVSEASTTFLKPVSEKKRDEAIEYAKQYIY